MVLTAHQDSNGANSFGLFGTSFTDRAQNKLDLDWAKAFNEAIASGMNIGDAKDDAFKKLGIDFANISEDVIALADKSTKAGIKIKDLGLKAKAASIGMKALSMAANAALTIFASWAIGKAIEYIDSLVHAQDRLEEKLANAKGKYQESEAAVKGLNDQLKNTEEQIKAIEDKGAFITPIEQAELDKLKETVEELNRLRDIQEDIAENNKKDLVQAAFEAYEGDPGKLFGRGGKANETMFVSESSALLSAANVSPESFGSVTGNYDSYSSEAGYADYLRNGAVLDLQQASEAYIVAYRIAKEERMKALEAGDEDLAQTWQDNADEANNYFVELYQWYETQLSGLSRIEGENLTTQQKVVNQMFDDMDIVGLFLSESSGRNVLEAQFNQVKEQYSDEFKELENYIKENGAIDESAFAEMFSTIASAFEKFNWTLPDVVTQVNAEFAPTTTSTTPSPTSYDQVTASSWRTTEAYKALTEAMEVQNEAGVLSTETYHALIEANAEYIELLELTAEGYKINEEALWKYIEAQDDLEKGEAIKAMMDLQNAMLQTDDAQEKLSYQNQIDNLAAYVQELDRATGALAKFRAAQETPDQDQEFSEGETAYETIKEGLKTGKVGTDNFQTAVGFVLGENWEQEFDSLEKAYAEASKLGKRYFGQDDERKGMANFRDDLVKNNLGSFDGETFKLFDGVTIEETAKQLGLSYDAAKSLFGLMEAYGADFEFPFVLTTEDIQNVEKFKDSLTKEELESGIEQCNKELETLNTQLETTNPETNPEEYVALEKQIDQTEHAAQVLQDELNEVNNTEVEVEPETLTLDQLYERLLQLETVVTTLEGLGITIPTEITGDIETIKELINQKEFEKNGKVVVSTDATYDAVKASLEDLGKGQDVYYSAKTNEVSYKDTDGALKQLSAEQYIATYFPGIDETTKNAVISALDDLCADRPITITAKYDLDGDGSPDGKTLDEFTAGIQAGIIESDGNGGYSYSGNDSKHVTEDVTVEAKADFSDVEKSKEKVEDTPLETTATVDPASTEQMSVDIQEQVESTTYTGEAQIMYDEPAGPPLPPDWTVPVSTDTSTAESQVDSVTSEIETGAIKPVDADVSEALKANASLESSLKRSVTKTIKLKASNVEPYASGTDSAAGGMSLVDEKGAELIEHTSRGTYELGTNNGARFTNLDPGDVVHTASETKKIMSRMAKIGGFFRDGLNKGKSIIGNAFATGVSGSMSWSLINKVLSSGSSSSSTKKNTSSSRNNTKISNWKTYVEKLFDWIEIRLDRLQTQTDKWILAASEAIGYMAKNTELDKALASTSQQIDETTQAYQRYIEQAQIIATKTKLSASVIKQIQEGTIDIASYSEANQEKIKAYQEW